MSGTEPSPPSKRGGYRQRADGAPRVNASKATANRGGMYQPIRDPSARAAARALYEATPGATCESVAQELGGKVPVGTVRRWKAEGGWKSAAKTVPDLAGRAGQLANTFRIKMSELGKPLSDEVAANEAAREVAVEHAVAVRGAVLDRHRKEWSAPRKLIYEAVQKRDFELAKLAKITGETLQIVQVGECRAFGLNHDARGADGGTVVVVERDAEPLALPDPGPIADDGTSTGTDDGGEF